ncbi:MAG: type II toxin-antitoxin system prevent-host-death family antitoxin [Candidatus Aerophobetes bacterium]
MVFANVRELRLKTAEILRKTDRGEHVFITYRGKPRAVIQRITEDEIEDYILLNHPKFKEKIEEAYKESLEGKVTDLDDLIAQDRERTCLDLE